MLQAVINQAQVLREHQLPIPLMGLPDAVESMAFLGGKCVTQNVPSEEEKTGWMWG
jgi:hypothetical protein